MRKREQRLAWDLSDDYGEEEEKEAEELRGRFPHLCSKGHWKSMGWIVEELRDDRWVLYAPWTPGKNLLSMSSPLQKAATQEAIEEDSLESR